MRIIDMTLEEWRHEVLKLLDEKFPQDLPSNEKGATNPEWLTAKEAAAYLCVSRSTLARRTRSSQIRSFEHGRCLRYKLSDLREYAENQAQ